MRMIPWSPIARRSTDDPAVEEKLLGLSLRDCCNYAAYCAAENLPRNVASFEAWQSQRLPGRGSGLAHPEGGRMIWRARNALRYLLGDAETPLSATIAYHSWLVENGRSPCTGALEDYLRERWFIAALAG